MKRRNYIIEIVNEVLDILTSNKLLSVSLSIMILLCVMFTVKNLRFIISMNTLLNNETTKIVIISDEVDREEFLQKTFPKAEIYMYPDDLEVLIGVAPKDAMKYEVDANE